MSRSARRLGPAKSGKSWGFEFWSSRPGNRCGGGIGRHYKTYTHRVERRQSKLLCRQVDE